MHLFTGTALFDGSARQCLDECQIALIGDEHRVGTVEKVHLTVSSDSWFVAFCIAHARHITAVAPETLRTMIVARAERELSISENK